MSHALARLARHRVRPEAHTWLTRLRVLAQWLLGATGLTLAVIADAAPAARGMPISAGALTAAAIVLLTLLGLFAIGRRRGARRLDHDELEQLQLRAQAHPEAARIVATWLELDLAPRHRDRRALERALTRIDPPPGSQRR